MIFPEYKKLKAASSIFVYGFKRYWFRKMVKDFFNFFFYINLKLIRQKYFTKVTYLKHSPKYIEHLFPKMYSGYNLKP